MKPLKITIIGGGSYQWTKKLFTDFALEPMLNGSRLMLHDINEEALEIMSAICRMINVTTAAGWNIETALNLDEALQDSDVVIVQISVGDFEAMRPDIEISAQYGVDQTVGDTVGPGGLSRALRSIPVILDIATKMEQLAPQAWLINLTNPMTTITRAINKYTHVKAIGLCHEVNKIRQRLQAIFNLESEAELSFKVGGVNHFTWLTDFKVRNEDGFELLIQYYRKGRLKFITDCESNDPFDNRFLLTLKLFYLFGVLPAAGDRHLAEFFPYFLKPESLSTYGIKLTGIDFRITKREQNKEQYLKILAGHSKLAITKSLEEISNLVVALFYGKPALRTVNLPNMGQIDNLPRETVVETLAFVNLGQVTPLAIGNMPNSIAGLLHRHIYNQELIVDSAFLGSKPKALQALINDPLISGVDQAEQLLDALLLANRNWLPRFFK
jgi:alpha-galactosidase/6-phospho-beta-glucosidase family protein